MRWLMWAAIVLGIFLAGWLAAPDLRLAANCYEGLLGAKLIHLARSNLLSLVHVFRYPPGGHICMAFFP